MISCSTSEWILRSDERRFPSTWSEHFPAELSSLFSSLSEEVTWAFGVANPLCTKDHSDPRYSVVRSLYFSREITLEEI